ncbi:MAG TPA: Sua5 family C-terminal domain-containing protein, partial [Clostridia bacterium]
SFEELNEVIPLECGVTPNTTTKPKAPGMKYTHYAPKAGMVLVVGETTGMLSRIKHLAGKYSSEGINVGIMATEQTKDSYGNEYCVFSMGNRDKPETIASRLFATLRSFDETDVGIIISESLPEEGIGSAIMNRLKKAAGGNLDRV